MRSTFEPSPPHGIFSSAAPVRRLGYVFMPMGADMARWTPAGGERLNELPFILGSLEPVKSQVKVVSHLEIQNAYPGPTPPPTPRSSRN